MTAVIKNIVLLFVFVGLGLITNLAHAQPPRKLTIQSSLDSFDLILTSETSGTVDGKPANLKVLADLWPVLNNPLNNDCPVLPTKADVTIKENGKVRTIYVTQGIVSDGQACLNVGGEGLYFFPVHRDFFIGLKKDSIKFASPVKIFRQGIKILEIKKSPQQQWYSEAQDTLINWDFIERLENSLKDFEVRLRAQTDIAKNKNKMLIQSGDQTYEFYKVTSVMWAVKKPGTNWLIASDEWSFWYDFDQSLIEDRFAPEIRLLTSAGIADAQRQEAMSKIEDGWSRNLRDLYHKIVLDNQESTDFKRTALNRLKKKPSLETSGTMVKFLNQSSDEDLKRLAGQILKTYFPKGPLYKPSLPFAEKTKVVDFWNNWWKKNQTNEN